MKKLSVFLCVAVATVVALVGFAGEKTIDWVALNGGSPFGVFGEGDNYGTNVMGAAHYVGSRIETMLSVEDERFKLRVISSNNSGWHGACFRFTNTCDVTFGEAQQIVMPYKYVTSGTGEVGQHFRLIIGTTTGRKYFGVISQETIIKGEESVLTFNLADAFSAYPTAYAAVKDSPITVMRLYPYNTGDEISTSETAGSQGRQRFASNDEIYIGAFTVKWTDVFGYTATFNANGGDPVADIQTGPDGEFVFPTATRDGRIFMGWYRDGLQYAAGSKGLLVMDSEFAAAWRNEDLTQGLLSTSTEYRKELDVYKAYGSCCDVFTGNTVRYYPIIDRHSSIREGVYQVDVEPLACGTETNINLIGKSGNAGNNSPEVVLPVVGVTVKDIYDVKVVYRTTSTALEGIAMTLRYQLGNTWYTVTSEDTIQCSTGDEFHTVKFKVAAALGEANYEKNKDKVIAAWRLRPYVGSALPFRSGVSMELGRIQLIGEHPNGLMLIIK